MLIINWIAERFRNASSFFYNLFLDTSGWIFPFNLISRPFYFIGNVFYDIGTNFYEFAEWLNGIIDMMGSFFSWFDLEAWFTYWKSLIVDLWNWFLDRWSWFASEVDNWWEATKSTVLSWINVAVQGLDNLKVEWQNFWTYTLPKLVNFFDLEEWGNSLLKIAEGLIDSTIKAWFPFYDNLTEIWDDIVEFFCNPLKFLLDRFGDWFFGEEK